MKNTQLYPIVTIEPDYMENYNDAYDELIHLSTNNVTLDHIHSKEFGLPTLENIHFKPLLLNIPSIKQSVDIESRKFKTSNVSLDISNYEYQGKRFSDILSETSLINRKVSIQFVSPSRKFFSTIFRTAFYTSGLSFYDHYKNDADHAPFMAEMVYQGVLRRISHDDKKVKIELEDLTEQKTHKNLPSENLPDTNSVPDKYKNKPIPMVYGHVEKSPVVADSNFNIFRIDYKNLEGTQNVFTGFEDSSEEQIHFGSLMVDTGEDTLYIEPKFGTITQYEFIDNYFRYTAGQSPFCTYKPTIKLKIQNQEEPDELGSINDEVSSIFNEDFLMPDYPDSSFIGMFDGDYSENPIGIDSKITRQIGTSNFITFTHFGFEIVIDYKNSFKLFSDNSPPSLVGFKINNLDIPRYLQNNSYVSSNDYSNYTAITDESIKHYEIINILFGFAEYYTTSGSTNYGIEDDINPDARLIFDVQNNITLGSVSIRPKTNLILFDNDASASKFKIQAKTIGQYNFQVSVDPSGNESTHPILEQTISLEGTLNEIELLSRVYPAEIFDKNFYANVKGRINTVDDHPALQSFPEGWGDISTWNGLLSYLNSISSISEDLSTSIDLYINSVEGYIDSNESEDNIETFKLFVSEHLFDCIKNPIDIIYDILISELELTADQINEDDYKEARDEHNGWEFGFTVNKKTNSKQLIEEIAKSTKCFPNFKNDGTFGFNTIKDSYTVSNEDGTGDYETATEIKESEIINYSFKKTKPEQIYKKVNVQYKKDYSQDSYLKKTESIDDENIDPYYGIEQDEAILDFESDYIRHDSTADKLRDFLYAQHINDHLIFNLKLSLSYNQLDIGDLVKFRSLLNGVKAYGIDYRAVDNPNGQTYYPLFMVISTKKNLDSVEIECMQLHHLTGTFDSDWVDYSENGHFYFPENTPTFVSPQEDLATGGFSSGQYFYEDINGGAYNGGSTRIRGIVHNYSRLYVYLEGEYHPNKLAASPSEGSFPFYKIEFQDPEGLERIEPPLFGDSNIVRAYHSYDQNGYNYNYGVSYSQQHRISLDFVDEVDNNGDGVADDIEYIPNSSELFGLENDTMIEFTLTPYQPPESVGQTYGTGDVNFDDDVNVLDVVTMVNWILGNQTPTWNQLYASDMNFDGGLNILDVVTTVNIIMNG